MVLQHFSWYYARLQNDFQNGRETKEKVEKRFRYTEPCPNH